MAWIYFTFSAAFFLLFIFHLYTRQPLIIGWGWAAFIFFIWSFTNGMHGLDKYLGPEKAKEFGEYHGKQLREYFTKEGE